MPNSRLISLSRLNRRRLLISVGGVGVLGVLGTIGFGPRILTPEPLLASDLTVALASATARPTVAATVTSHRMTPVPTSTPTATSVLPSATVPFPLPAKLAPTAKPTSTPSPPPFTPTDTVTPTAFDADRLVDLVGQAKRSYAGSAFSLATNIEVAAKRLDGAVVAPGATFSFLDQVGRQTAEAGFQMGFGISLVGGQPQTVPMMAGGICDVSTLLFQAVYKAGLGIVQRYSHSYWIASYGAPPDGGVGLEATVDFQPVDFRFANTTRDWLKLSCICADGWITLMLFGANPGWTVTIAPPVVSNVVKTDPTVVRRLDSNLPAGVEVLVEQAQDGFDVTRERHVTYVGQLLDSYQYTAHYVPSHNVVLYGGSTPSPTPTATPTVKK